jgi:hypothetical protein
MDESDMKAEFNELMEELTRKGKLSIVRFDDI